MSPFLFSCQFMSVNLLIYSKHNDISHIFLVFIIAFGLLLLMASRQQQFALDQFPQIAAQFAAKIFAF
ncbi:hypothetical protein GARCT_03214 [Geobacillus sp. 12AMOR1]|nr:hypothetical protein GARCT_03214 [Geobacillus sp. 12AMOR1]